MAVAVGWLIAQAEGWVAGGEPPFPFRRTEAPFEPPPIVTARALVVLDVNSGELLLSIGGHTPHPPGPLAQLATLWVAWHERVRVAEAPFDEAVLVSERAANRLGTSMGLRYGESVSLIDLVTGILYLGAADAVHALTEHVWGSEAAFARQVHHQLAPFGVRESRFASPQGIDRPAQETTAYDMALLARHLLLDPVLGPLATQRRGTVYLGGERQSVVQYNSFLLRYPGASGLKSGYSEAAGYVAAASSRRNGRHLVAVILGAASAEERYAQLAAALDYAFRNAAVLEQQPWVDALPYDVQPGDTLTAIAHRFGIDAERIQIFNALDDPGALQAGRRLWLPVDGGGEK